VGSQRVAAFALFLLIVPSSQAIAEEPLPIVRARGFLTTTVDLPTEPLRDDDFVTVALTDTITTPARAMETLRAAVAANDFPRFRSALTQATFLADRMPLGDARNTLRRNLLIYRDVEQLWSFARGDRFGAFFDDEALPGMRDHLAADYRGLDAFLTANRIVDRNGIELYPTSETRAYLMRLVEPSPRGVKPSLVASTATAAPKAIRHHAATPHTTPPHAVAAKAPAKARVVIAKVAAAAVVAPPVVVAQAPAIVTPKADAFAAPETVAVLPKETELPRVQPAQVVASPSSGRGLFFIILALALLGGLMMMLRAPEAPPAVIPAPDEKKPVRREDEVIPLKKAQ
jgi:hypothetical protein